MNWGCSSSMGGVVPCVVATVRWLASRDGRGGGDGQREGGEGKGAAGKTQSQIPRFSPSGPSCFPEPGACHSHHHPSPWIWLSQPLAARCCCSQPGAQTRGPWHGVCGMQLAWTRHTFSPSLRHTKKKQKSCSNKTIPTRGHAPSALLILRGRPWTQTPGSPNSWHHRGPAELHWPPSESVHQCEPGRTACRPHIPDTHPHNQDRSCLLGHGHGRLPRSCAIPRHNGNLRSASLNHITEMEPGIDDNKGRCSFVMQDIIIVISSFHRSSCAFVSQLAFFYAIDNPHTVCQTKSQENMLLEADAHKPAPDVVALGRNAAAAAEVQHYTMSLDSGRCYFTCAPESPLPFSPIFHQHRGNICLSQSLSVQGSTFNTQY